MASSHLGPAEDFAVRPTVAGQPVALLSEIGGGAGLSEVEIDFGAKAIKEKVFTVTNAAVTAGSKILPMQSGKAATGRQADENEFDVISFRAVPGAGQFTLYATCLTGLVQGPYKMVYQVS